MAQIKQRRRKGALAEGARLLLASLLLFLLGACQSESSPMPAESPQVGTSSETDPQVVASPAATTASPAAAAVPTETATAESAATSPTAESTRPIEPAPELARLPAGDIFHPLGDEAVVAHGERGEWDGQFTDPGAVVYHDGAFHMFRNGFVGWPSPVAIGYLTSPDGLQWTEVDEEPILSLDSVDYVGFTALASSALVEEDGTWVLYLYSWDRDASAASAPSKIIRAMAPDPTGPWTPDDEPLLLPGREGEWDSLALRAPSVVKADGRYLMFYSGYTNIGMSVGLATSEDGVRWQKYDDPATSGAPFAESDPVFTAGEAGSWDDSNVYQPRVVSTPDGFFMVYSSSPAVGGAGAQLGYAYSADGLHWVPSEGPVMEHNRVPGGRALWFTEFAYHDGTYLLFLEVGLGGETEIYLATRYDPLPTPSAARTETP